MRIEQLLELSPGGDYENNNTEVHIFSRKSLHTIFLATNLYKILNQAKIKIHILLMKNPEKPKSYMVKRMKIW